MYIRKMHIKSCSNLQNLLCSSADLGLWIGTSVVPGGKNCAAALTVATTMHKVMAAAMAAKAAA